jgi:hypothetical protein
MASTENIAALTIMVITIVITTAVIITKVSTTIATITIIMVTIAKSLERKAFIRLLVLATIMVRRRDMRALMMARSACK